MAAKASRRPVDLLSWVVWLVLAIIIGGGAFLISRKHAATVLVWKPSDDLPAYHLITNSNVITATIALSAVPANAFPTGQTLVGYYTRQPVKEGQPLTHENLVISPDPALTSGTVPVSIPASPAHAFNGHLAPGSVVTIWSIDRDNGEASVLLQRALVIDMQEVEGAPENEASSYVIVLAVPENYQAPILAAATNNSLALTISP